MPCTTYLVQPGQFDIFFPTDFEDLLELYHRLNRPSHPKLECLSHADFVGRYGVDDLRETCLADGSNPMLDYYENVRVVVTE